MPQPLDSIRADLVPTIRLAPGLKLRAFHVTDAARLARLAGERSVVESTLGIPSPYELDSARDWIAGLPARFEEGVEVIFALVRAHALIGSVGLTLEREHGRAEIGYWLGKAFRGRGYARLAVNAVSDFALSTLRLQRIYGLCFSENLSSQGLLRRCGYRREGTLRQHIIKDGLPRDVVCFAKTLSSRHASARLSGSGALPCDSRVPARSPRDSRVPARSPRDSNLNRTPEN